MAGIFSGFSEQAPFLLAGGTAGMLAARQQNIAREEAALDRGVRVQAIQANLLGQARNHLSSAAHDYLGALANPEFLRQLHDGNLLSGYQATIRSMLAGAAGVIPLDEAMQAATPYQDKVYGRPAGTHGKDDPGELGALAGAGGAADATAGAAGAAGSVAETSPPLSLRGDFGTGGTPPAPELTTPARVQAPVTRPQVGRSPVTVGDTTLTPGPAVNLPNPAHLLPESVKLRQGQDATSQALGYTELPETLKEQLLNAKPGSVEIALQPRSDSGGFSGPRPGATPVSPTLRPTISTAPQPPHVAPVSPTTVSPIPGGGTALGQISAVNPGLAHTTNLVSNIFGNKLEGFQGSWLPLSPRELGGLIQEGAAGVGSMAGAEQRTVETANTPANSASSRVLQGKQALEAGANADVTERLAPHTAARLDSEAALARKQAGLVGVQTTQLPRQVTADITRANAMAREADAAIDNAYTAAGHLKLAASEWNKTPGRARLQEVFTKNLDGLYETRTFHVLKSDEGGRGGGLRIGVPTKVPVVGGGDLDLNYQGHGGQRDGDMEVYRVTSVAHAMSLLSLVAPGGPLRNDPAANAAAGLAWNALDTARNIARSAGTNDFNGGSDMVLPPDDNTIRGYLFSRAGIMKSSETLRATAQRYGTTPAEIRNWIKAGEAWWNASHPIARPTVPPRP